MCCEIRGVESNSIKSLELRIGSINKDFLEGKSVFQEILKSCMGKGWGMIGFSTRRACLKARKLYEVLGELEVFHYDFKK